MLKEAGHIDAVKRLRVGEQDLEPLVLHYEVCFFLLLLPVSNG